MAIEVQHTHSQRHTQAHMHTHCGKSYWKISLPLVINSHTVLYTILGNSIHTVFLKVTRVTGHRNGVMSPTQKKSKIFIIQHQSCAIRPVFGKEMLRREMLYSVGGQVWMEIKVCLNGLIV